MTTATQNDPGAITDEQRELYEAMGEHGTSGTLLMSVIEKATGQQRAVVCTVGWDEDSKEYITRPILMLLESEDDMDRFQPPSGTSEHEGH